MPGKVTDDPSSPGRGPLRDQDASTAADEHDALDGAGVRRLYTAALMADVLRTSPAAIRHWVRGGLLVPARRAGSIEWFDFGQLVVGRHLARLLAGGLSLREIDAKLAGLAAGGGPAAARVAERIVADGRRLSLRDGDRLLAAGGQLQLDFYTADLADGGAGEGPPRVVPLGEVPETRGTDGADRDADRSVGDDVAEILGLADELEAAGEFEEAAEALRAVLQSQGPHASVLFTLAELLYRAGDLPAARERYYAVIEIDAGHLRARTSLGCVLAELGDHELALAALEGVLRQEPGYADAHWHVAGILADLGRAREARHHLGTFLALAPESPWAALARQRLDALT
ncbi:MAG: tetratricopeptide repeat protein [Planctomycetaceae bacterium]